MTQGQPTYKLASNVSLALYAKLCPNKDEGNQVGWSESVSQDFEGERKSESGNSQREQDGWELEEKWTQRQVETERLVVLGGVIGGSLCFRTIQPQVPSFYCNLFDLRGHAFFFTQVAHKFAHEIWTPGHVWWGPAYSVHVLPFLSSCLSCTHALCIVTLSLKLFKGTKYFLSSGFSCKFFSLCGLL